MVTPDCLVEWLANKLLGCICSYSSTRSFTSYKTRGVAIIIWYITFYHYRSGNILSFKTGYGLFLQLQLLSAHSAFKSTPSCLWPCHWILLVLNQIATIGTFLALRLVFSLYPYMCFRVSIWHHANTLIIFSYLIMIFIVDSIFKKVYGSFNHVKINFYNTWPSRPLMSLLEMAYSSGLIMAWLSVAYIASALRINK